MVERLNNSVEDLNELFELSEDESEANQLKEELFNVEEKIADLEFRRMFSGKMDQANTYLDIQSGSGGTEAQDWAEMLLRMYLRWGENKDFNTELIEVSPGEVAGIKSATIKFEGEFAVGLEQNQVFIDWLESLLSILEIVAIPLLHQFLYHQK